MGCRTSKPASSTDDDEVQQSSCKFDKCDYEYWCWEPDQECIRDRLFSLLADDSVAHALVFVAAMLFFLDIHWPSLLLMVLSPAFVGALLVLDYCGQVKEEVRRLRNLHSQRRQPIVRI